MSEPHPTDRSIVRQIDFLVQSVEGSPLYHDAVETPEGRVDVKVTKSGIARVEVFNSNMQDYCGIVANRSDLKSLIDMLTAALGRIPTAISN